MTPTERLAAYVSGDLDANETAALEARLAREPALRERLDAIRDTDRALAALPEVTLPDGFESRLADALRPELDAVLGDELAGRRARRWIRPAAAAAAAVAVIAVGGVIFTQNGAQDDSSSSLSADVGQQQAQGGQAARPEADADGGQRALQAPFGAEAAPAIPHGPRIVADRRTLAGEDLVALASNPDVPAVVDEAAANARPADTALSYARALGADMAAYSRLLDAQTLDRTTPSSGDAAASATAAPEVTTQGAVTDDAKSDVGRCLPTLQEDANTPLVPLYAELATDTDGTDVTVYAALAPDENGAYRRVKVWMVDRESCALLRFVQHDR